MPLIFNYIFRYLNPLSTGFKEDDREDVRRIARMKAIRVQTAQEIKKWLEGMK